MRGKSIINLHMYCQFIQGRVSRTIFHFQFKSDGNQIGDIKPFRYIDKISLTDLYEVMIYDILKYPIQCANNWQHTLGIDSIIKWIFIIHIYILLDYWMKWFVFSIGIVLVWIIMDCSYIAKAQLLGTGHHVIFLPNQTYNKRIYLL